jgi:uncharacterized protein (TIGR02001 family)
MNLTKHTLLAAAALSLCGIARAQTPPAAPAAPEATSPWAFNIGLISDYRFRGLSQSNRNVALQAGIDYAFDSGFYLGFWSSSIRWIKKFGGDGPVELDFYGGYKGKINDSLSYDVGYLRYQYPNASLATTPNTNELYGALTFGPATVKYSRSINDKTFGFAKSSGSYYLEAAATFDTGMWGLTVTPHIGHQHFTGGINTGASYTDYSLTLGKDFGNGVSVSLAGVDTSGAPKAIYTPPSGKYMGKAGAVIGVKYTF